MKDLTELAKAVVAPYFAIYSLTIMGLMALGGQDIPQWLWITLVGSLAELGFEFGYKKVKK